MDEITIKIDKGHIELHIIGDIRISYPINRGYDNAPMIDAVLRDVKKSLYGGRVSTLG